MSQNNTRPKSSWVADPGALAWAAPRGPEPASPARVPEQPDVTPAVEPATETEAGRPSWSFGEQPSRVTPPAPAEPPAQQRGALPPSEPAAPVAPAGPSQAAPPAGNQNNEQPPSAAAGGGFTPLATEGMVRVRRTPPRDGWRSAVYKLTAGRINPGLSEVEERRRALLTKIRTPLAGPFSIAVGSIKGGIGKTTVASLLGLALAEHRGDRVIAIDANPDAGTLADRLVGEGAVTTTIRDLLDQIDQVRTSTQLSGYTHLAGRLQVLASEQEPELSEMFSKTDYAAVLQVLSRFFECLITDSGTGIVHSAMQGTLDHADSLVVVGAPTQDGASRAARTLDWLTAQGFHELAQDAVVVLSCDRYSPDVDIARIRDHFRSRCRALVELPPDKHLSTGGLIDLDALAPNTRDAALELAAAVADGFHGRRTRGLAAHGFR